MRLTSESGIQTVPVRGERIAAVTAAVPGPQAKPEVFVQVPVPPGKVLNVTKFDKITGQGARNITRPRGIRKGFYEVPGVDLISYDKFKLEEALRDLHKENLINNIKFFQG